MFKLNNSTALAVVRTDINLNLINKYRETYQWLQALNISGIENASLSQLETCFKVSTMVPGNFAISSSANGTQIQTYSFATYAYNKTATIQPS